VEQLRERKRERYCPVCVQYEYMCEIARLHQKSERLSDKERRLLCEESPVSIQRHINHLNERSKHLVVYNNKARLQEFKSMCYKFLELWQASPSLSINAAANANTNSQTECEARHRIEKD
jgi:hypothetical protein